MDKKEEEKIIPTSIAELHNNVQLLQIKSSENVGSTLNHQGHENKGKLFLLWLYLLPMISYFINNTL